MIFKKGFSYCAIKKTKQKLVNKVRIVIVGVGALGCMTSKLLVMAGLKNIVLIDRDVVEKRNLGRQILYSLRDVGKSKVDAAAEKIKRINKKVKIKRFAVDLSYKNVDILDGDLIVDCTDNIETRFLINDYAKKNMIAWIFGSVLGSSGMCCAITDDSPCLRCFIKKPEEALGTCETEGISDNVITCIAELQAEEALKVISREKVCTDLIYVDILKQKIDRIKIGKDNKCPACNGRYEYLDGKADTVIKMCGTGKYQIKGKRFDLKRLNNRLKNIGATRLFKNHILFDRLRIFEDGRVLVEAKSEEEAKSVYTRYLE